ncbi:MAG TPA: arginase family protein [Ktedonobacterales bacterium]
MHSPDQDLAAVHVSSRRRFRAVGVPFAAGALGQGASGAPAALRRAGLLSQARAVGLDFEDVGDVTLPEAVVSLFHSVPPIRHWPLPRHVWEATRNQLRPVLEAGDFALALGGDCSIFVGVAQALIDVVGPQKVHVLYIDGHIDAEAPRAAACVGAAAMGLRIATEASPFWPGPMLPASAVSAIGCSRQIHVQIPHFTLEDVRGLGAEQVARLALQRCAAAEALLVHFDVDVMADAELPGAYDPSTDGLTRDEAFLLLRTILADPRVRAAEVTEYCPENDPDQRGATTLVQLLTTACAAGA